MWPPAACAGDGKGQEVGVGVSGSVHKATMLRESQMQEK